MVLAHEVSEFGRVMEFSQLKNLLEAKFGEPMKKLNTRLAVLLLSTLGLLTGVYGQTAATSSTRSLPKTPSQRKLAQMRTGSGQTLAPDKQIQSPPTRLDPGMREHAAHAASPESLRLPGAPVAAERYVFGRMDLAVDAYPQAVAIGAFQTGGPQSIASVTYDPGTVSILLGNPDGTFQPKTDYPVSVGADAIATGDFNGDGNLDLAVAAYDGIVSILLGNGDGTFKPQVEYSCVETCTSVVVGDFNRDGKLDLALDSYDGSNGLIILLGNGDGTFQPPVGYAAPTRPQFLTAGDFNGDGILDIATVVAFGDTVAVYLGKGDGSFKPYVEYVTGYEPQGIATGDFRGDGKLDLVTANIGAGTVSILLGNGDGTFQNHVDYAAGGSTWFVTAGDFNGDGKLDLAATNYGDNTVSILLGKGNGTFAPQVAYGVGAGDYGIAAGDLNGDGRLDLVVGNQNANTVSVLVGKGNGTFQSPQDYALPGLGDTVAIADFNNDGKPDLAVDTENNTIAVLLNKGGGKFGAPVAYPVGYAPYGVSAADFGNGQMDLAVANEGENTISVLLGNGDGTFQTQTQYASGKEPQGTVEGDFNGSGNLGLATDDFDGPGDTAVLLGNGNGTFQPFVSSPGTPAYTALLAAADFRGNGTVDLAITGTDENTNLSYVYIELGNGDGTFQPSIGYPTGGDSEGIVVADFNNDGRLDIATANDDDNTVSVLLGNGDGTFQPQLVFPVGVGPFLLTVGDFNADGNLDLAVTNGNCCLLPGTVSVLLGNGDGTFQPHMDYPFSEYPFGVAAGNLSGQGGSDLAVVNYLSSSVAVLLNLPVISVFPNSLNFGTVKVGTSSAPQVVTITNPSGTPIDISKTGIVGADAKDFAETNTCPITPKTLAPGAQCTFTITFTPKVTGTLKAEAGLEDSVPGSPQGIRLAGTGQ
jgi:hypothetical protein